MINWCAYCQTWQGEVPPLDSFELTHGICPACLERGVASDVEAIEAIKPVADFFRALRREARSGFSTPGTIVLDQAAKLGVRPLELLVGLLQPALDEIGKLWARGEVTVAAEHQFSSMVQTVVVLVLERVRVSNPALAAAPEFLLVNAEGNQHALGARVVEAFLISHRRTVLTVVPGLPVAEVVELVRAVRPRTLGVSVAAAGELDSVEALATALTTLPAADRPRLVVGGQAVRAGARLGPSSNVVVCADLRELLTPEAARPSH